jgi:hypothetical protein
VLSGPARDAAARRGVRRNFSRRRSYETRDRSETRNIWSS